MPPLRGTEVTERMGTTARKLGWHAFPGPAAINSTTYDERPSCQYHGFCNRGGCHVSAKNSTAVKRRSQSDTDGSGAGLADRGASRRQLESYFKRLDQRHERLGGSRPLATRASALAKLCHHPDR